MSRKALPRQNDGSIAMDYDESATGVNGLIRCSIMRQDRQAYQYATIGIPREKGVKDYEYFEE
jgi:hypothetical protein